MQIAMIFLSLVFGYCTPKLQLLNLVLPLEQRRESICDSSKKPFGVRLKRQQFLNPIPHGRVLRTGLFQEGPPRRRTGQKPRCLKQLGLPLH